MLLVLWAQAVVNGAILVVWRPTRMAGVGILLGTLIAAAIFVIFPIYVITSVPA